MFLKELMIIENDSIEGLPKGKDLFKQYFHFYGAYDDSAKKIIADKLSGRWAVVVQQLSQGNQGVTDRNYSTYVDLGLQGHGFIDKNAANARVRFIKKSVIMYNKKNQAKEKYLYAVITCRVNDIDSTLNKLKSMPGDSSYRDIGLSYA